MTDKLIIEYFNSSRDFTKSETPNQSTGKTPEGGSGVYDLGNKEFAHTNVNVIFG